MTTNCPTYDLIIIGGGISGLGLFAEAGRAGLTALLLESAPQFSAGTSAASLRIMHGGLRYLQSLDLPRSLESIRAQGELLHRYPELVSPIPSAIPRQRFGARSAVPLFGATLLYEALKFVARPSYRLPRSALLSASDLPEILGSERRHGGFRWWDALLSDPAALAAGLVAEGVRLGGVARCGARVERVDGVSAAVSRSGSATLGRVVHFLSEQGTEQAHGALVVNTAGAALWSIPVAELSPPPRRQRWARAFNLWCRRPLVGQEVVGAFYRGRGLFIAPRSDQNLPAMRCALGTWYQMLPEDVATAARWITEEQTCQAMNEMNAAFPEARLIREDIIGSEVGMVPAKGCTASGEVELYGREQLFVYHHYIAVLSTKYTTFAEQARRVLSVGARFFSK